MTTELAVLELAVEDYFGLWELLSVVTDAEEPAQPTRRRVAAEHAVLRLLHVGAVELFRGIAFAGEQRAVEDAAAELARDENWEPPSPLASHVRLAATKAGEDLYYRRANQVDGGKTRAPDPQQND